MLSSITETTCCSLNDHSVVQLKMPVRFVSYTMKFDTPKSPSSSLQPVCSLPLVLFPSVCLSVCLSVALTKQGPDIQGYSNFVVAQASKLLLWMLLPSPNTIRQLSFICAIRPVSASVKVLLPNSHTVMNDIPSASKWYFGKCCRGYQGGGFILFIFCVFF